ncbi:hypothetical protein Slala05_62540 [Streptomyces lavendulae subsp. lavendulae]|nr:hypothetical protein Slala05_62540 [Streptomyces lavendulae subsp. lavendulae]
MAGTSETSEGVAMGALRGREGARTGWAVRRQGSRKRGIYWGAACRGPVLVSSRPPASLNAGGGACTHGAAPPPSIVCAAGPAVSTTRGRAGRGRPPAGPLLDEGRSVLFK